MALLDRCTSLRERVANHKSLRQAHKEAEAFRNRANALEEIHHELAAAVRKVDVLRLKGLEVTKLPHPTAALTACDEYVTELTDGSAEGASYSRFKRSVDKVTVEVAAAVTKAIEAVKRDLPSIEEPFLKQVELIPTYTEQVAHIRKERDVLFAKGDPASMLPEELAAFLDRREDLRRLADRLNPTDFPKEVLDFFKAARLQDGAPLEKLTGTVRAWLQEREQLKNVRVRVLAR